MKHLFTLILCASLAPACHGQEVSLGDCISQGIARNLTLENARIDISKGQTTVTQNRSRLLPVISGSLQWTDYLKSPVNVTTGTRLGSDFPDDPTWQTIKSMPYSATAGVQLSMPLYDKGIFSGIEVARTVERIRSLSYEKAVEDLTVQIGRVYYAAQTSREQERLAQENIDRMKALCLITEALYEQGVVMEVDLNRVRISLKNLEAAHDQCLTLHQQQLHLLRYLMDLSPDEPLEVMRMDEDFSGPCTAGGVNDRLPELKLTAQQQVLAEQRIKSVRASRLPVLSFSAYAGGLAYQEKFTHFFSTSAAKDNWFGHSFVGLTMRVPLFDGNSRKLQIRQYRLEAMQAAHRSTLVRQQMDKDYAQASLQLKHNVEVLRTQTESRKQAEEVYQVTEEQYKEGVSSMTALLQDEMQLRTAQTACVQALCQCRLAELDLLRLSGQLSRLSGEF